ncbi:hypothetical protein BU15DRAFT_66586 [Melanogaster broomeanus]|nr:hypothetical protein BU15DRAFT_66586 [Melanogaster broomeanus]
MKVTPSRRRSLQPELNRPARFLDVMQLPDDQQMAAPCYFDPLKTGKFGPPRCSRVLYMSDPKLLVIVSRGPCGSRLLSGSAWSVFGQRIVDLDLFPVHPRTKKEDIVSVNPIILELISYGVYALQYANIIWNPIRVFEWFAFTCVYPLVKRGNHLIVTPGRCRHLSMVSDALTEVVLENEMTITSGQVTILPDRRVRAHARNLSVKNVFLFRYTCDEGRDNAVVGTLDLSHLKNGNAMNRSALDLKHTLGFRTPPPRLTLASTVERAPAIIKSNRLPAYWISSWSNHPLISADDLVINYTPELPPALYEISFSLKLAPRQSKPRSPSRVQVTDASACEPWRSRHTDYLELGMDSTIIKNLLQLVLSGSVAVSYSSIDNSIALTGELIEGIPYGP